MNAEIVLFHKTEPSAPEFGEISGTTTIRTMTDLLSAPWQAAISALIGRGKFVVRWRIEWERIDHTGAIR